MFLTNALLYLYGFPIIHINSSKSFTQLKRSMLKTFNATWSTDGVLTPETVQPSLLKHISTVSTLQNGNVFKMYIKDLKGAEKS